MKHINKFINISVIVSIFTSNIIFANTLNKIKEKDTKVYGVILAGGSGKRLWPFSRNSCPKQFIKFIQGKTLIESTYDRIEKLASNNSIWAVTTSDHKSSVMKFGSSINSIVTEPLSRNTAPAILLTALKIYEKDPEALIFFVPADHHIPDTRLFRHTMRQALIYAKNNNEIVLLGIQPRYAASEYGYIEYGSLKDHSGVYAVTKFHEKPSVALAKQYIESGNMLWNAGIFCAKASVFISEFEKHSPDLTQKIKDYNSGKGVYDAVPDCPFDTSVLEKQKIVLLYLHTFNGLMSAI